MSWRRTAFFSNSFNRLPSGVCHNLGVQPLPSHVLTTYLVLTALLISNWVGLVHVGCTGGKQHASIRQLEVKSCSCHHHHCDRSQKSSHESQQPLPADEHDCDRCTICQHFFASRNAVFTFTQVIEKPLPTQRLCVERRSNPIVAMLLYGLSVRGPPVA